MKNSKLLLLLSAVLLLSGCGVKKKQLLSTISKGMQKHEIKQKMGKPAETSTTKNAYGQEIEVWEYELATVNEAQRSKRATLIVISVLCCFPALFALLFMDSKYNYDNYFVEFQNNHVQRWGRSADLGLEKLT